MDTIIVTQTVTMPSERGQLSKARGVPEASVVQEEGLRLG